MKMHFYLNKAIAEFPIQKLNLLNMDQLINLCSKKNIT